MPAKTKIFFGKFLSGCFCLRTDGCECVGDWVDCGNLNFFVAVTIMNDYEGSFLQLKSEKTGIFGVNMSKRSILICNLSK